MTGVAAYVVLVVVVPALLLGHQGQPWPLCGACAWLRDRLTASHASKAPQPHRSPERPTDGRSRPRPSWSKP